MNKSITLIKIHVIGFIWAFIVIFFNFMFLG